MVRNLNFVMICALALALYVILIIWRLESFSFFLPLMLRGLVSILIFVAGLVLGFKMLAKREFPGTIICFLFCLVPIAATMTSERLFNKKMDETLLRANLIITALNKHYSNNMNYPMILEELVPKYISSIPPTAMGIISTHQFNYEKESLEFRLSFEATDGIHCKFTPNNDLLCDD